MPSSRSAATATCETCASGGAPGFEPAFCGGMIVQETNRSSSTMRR